MAERLTDGKGARPPVMAVATVVYLASRLSVRPFQVSLVVPRRVGRIERMRSDEPAPASVDRSAQVLPDRTPIQFMRMVQTRFRV
jgi:hypothetical protein